MRQHQIDDDFHHYTDIEYEYEEDEASLNHRRQVRRMLEDRLERRRLKAEIEDDFEDEFDWGDLDR